jgi:transcriptional regulator with XRE-family HTH domain
MLTKFGKTARKIRIDRNEYLADMAEKLGVSPSLLSAVENGRRAIPQKWYHKVAAAYSLSAVESEALFDSFIELYQGVFVTIEDTAPEEREAFLSLLKIICNFSGEILKQKVREWAKED